MYIIGAVATCNSLVGRIVDVSKGTSIAVPKLKNTPILHIDLELVSVAITQQ